ncbi:orotidine-5'-phosphate decarboxylase [Halobacillus karajensis]|uniref:Orotidine 5'-phosphate decarboxylase n=1 Tax=Halobacillus karajensis TaxID=195088 RepID=A0A024P2I3_9BACI|nr:orotidine-5'-phosphate decarboxylase [Halobacillus karajensis]CDQ19813.1 Orotidine 5'-phosphate decarboxylase [Halobacillus karajensis]CDQ22273.1 Orotidine 5'-phosphate decarboxylase [Halobacillus karajensis]CDQ28114.1 Orotidine 5'-phosphate decarboxylase [Halobacillus karajensis]
MKKLDPIYFALDFESGKEALSFLNEHSLEGIPVKVGMELYYKEGASIIHALKKNGHSIFLDLKLHDIPETVSRSMRSLAGLDIEVINVHAQGGAEMMQAAKRGLEEGAAGEVPLLLAVTVLTSSDQKMLNEEMLVNHSLSDVVKHYGQLAEKCGVDGVVCSVSEAAIIKKETNLAALTPGIRLSGGEKHDQKRVATPAVAEEKGSDSIVVGRAIRDARQPEKTYQQIKEAFQHAKSVHHS